MCMCVVVLTFICSVLVLADAKSTGSGTKSFLGSDSTSTPSLLDQAAPSRNSPWMYTPSAGGLRTCSGSTRKKKPWA